MAVSAMQRYLAEFLGSTGLLLFGGGTAVSTFFLPFQGAARDVAVAAAFGFVLAALAYAFGGISGAHFNPAVTVSMAVSRKMPMRDVVPYLVAQVLGAMLGMGIVLGVVSGWTPGWNIAHSSELASQCYAGSGAPAGCNFGLASVFLLEAALVFVFVLIIHMVTRPESTAPVLAPAAIGFALFVTNLMAIPIDGASINPVRSLGPALVASIAWGPSWALAEVWLFIVAPIVGGVIASLVERALRPSAAVR
jgi:aquaporin Z